MSRRAVLRSILGGSKKVRFADMVGLIEGFGFRFDRQNGSHYIFVHPNVPELVNLQSVDGKVKPYQVRQFLKIVEKYNLVLED